MSRRMKEILVLDDDLELEITGEYIPFEPEIRYLNNGDPGDPGFPPFFEFDEIKITKGNLLNFINYFAGWNDIQMVIHEKIIKQIEK
jgi:hypothetical protein